MVGKEVWQRELCKWELLEFNIRALDTALKIIKERKSNAREKRKEERRKPLTSAVA